MASFNPPRPPDYLLELFKRDVENELVKEAIKHIEPLIRDKAKEVVKSLEPKIEAHFSDLSLETVVNFSVRDGKA